MPRSQIAVGIDVGAHSLKAVVLRKTGSHVALLRTATVELGELAFIDDSERKDQRVAELLRGLLRKARIRRRTALVGLSGRDYFVKYLHLPPTTPDKLRKLIDYEVSEDPTSTSHQQSADFCLLDLPTRSEEFTVLVVLSRKDTLDRRLRLLKQAGIAAEHVTLNAIGLFNSYVNALDEDIYNDKTTLLVDIGGEHMDVVVQRNAKLLFIRNLSLGGGRFTEAVQEEFQLPIREAEGLKLSKGAILPGHFDVAAEIDTSTPEARLSAALLEPAESIYDTLQATIKYCQTQTRMTNLRIDDVVLSGRAARLRGLREFLAQRFRTPVDILDPFRGIETGGLPPGERDEVAEDAPSYSVAVGLALREFEEPHMRRIALLPEDLRRRREFLSHGFFVYVAAAVFALAFATMVYSSSLATTRAERELRVKKARISEAEALDKQLQDHLGLNTRLAQQTQAIQHMLDTGRRCTEVLAILKETLPAELTVDSISTVTDTPSPRARKRRRDEEEQQATTHLVIQGQVAERFGDREVTLGEAQHIVDNFLKNIEEQGASRLQVREVLDWQGLCEKLDKTRPAAAPRLGATIWGLLPPGVQALVHDAAEGNLLTHDARTRVVEGVNEVMLRRDFYREADFQDLPLPKEAQELLKPGHKAMSQKNIQRFNRILLETAYPQELAQSLFSQAKVTRYPDPKEPVSHRTFEMIVFFVSVFQGG